MGDPEGDKKAEDQRGTIDLVRASRIGFDFVATVAACIAAGWYGDKVFDTAPYGLLGLSVIGFVAGVRNLWRALNEGK